VILSVVFFLWSDPKWRNAPDYSYTMDHVTRAMKMVDRHLNVPHRFILVSDQPVTNGCGLSYVEIDRKLLALGRCWPKLMIFAPYAPILFGDWILYMDLDQVVVGDLTPMITNDDFRIAEPSAKGMFYNGSMILLKTGSRDKVWSEFEATPVNANKLVAENRIMASDQHWYGKCLGPDEKTWNNNDGIYSFRHIQPPDALPADARVVFFSGPWDPSQPKLRQQYKWIKDNWK
jgi:hypothetical protein